MVDALKERLPCVAVVPLWLCSSGQEVCTSRTYLGALGHVFRTPQESIVSLRWNSMRDKSRASSMVGGPPLHLTGFHDGGKP